jgi:hypothetical protein
MEVYEVSNRRIAGVKVLKKKEKSKRNTDGFIW